MSNEEKREKTDTYRWIKRGVALLMVGIWIVLMITIFRSGGTFADQAPKCIFTTMIVFGILTAIYKGIEHLEMRNEE